MLDRVASVDEATTARDAPRPGLSLDGRYVLDREVGSGGMARVFVARDEKLGRDVAIKVLKAGPHEPTQLARLAREARTAGSLAHPNIVAIHDVGSFEGEPYVVQEMLRGETLRDRLRRGPVPPERALDLALQLARGLSAAHAQGIVHRDIKPENLFVTSDGALKILDFGIAVLQAPAQGPSTWSDEMSIAGTPAYMSPEQINGRPTDARTDVFSFGVVLYEMLAGKPAFEQPTAFATAFAVLRDAPAALPPQVPPALARITLRSLEKDPEARFPSARELAAELEQLQGDLGRPARLRRRALLVALTGLGLTLIGIGFLRLRRSHPPPQFRQLTFERGAVTSARFAPDGTSVLYSVTEDGATPRVRATSLAQPEFHGLDVPPATLLAVSAKGELALLLRPEIARFGFNHGVLARLQPGAGAARELLENVEYADWSPDGSDLAVVRAEGGRTRLEYPAGHVLYETSGWIGDPRFSPDGREIAFVHHTNPVESSGSILVTDLAGTVRTVTPSWRYLRGLAWAPRTSEIWFTAADIASAAANLALRSVRRGGGESRLIAQIGGNLELQDLAPDGRALVTEPVRRLGLAILEAGDARPRDLSWFDQTFLGDLSLDGKEVLFTVEGAAAGNASSVYVRRTDGSAPVHLGQGYGVALSPDGRWAISLALTGPPLQPITLLPTGPGEPRRLDAAGVTATRIRWFADGKRLLIAGLEAQHGLRLYVRSVDGGSPVPISPEGIHITGMAVSRDGKFAAAGDPSGRTALFPVEGGDATVVAGVAPEEVPIGFTDGGELLVARLRPAMVPVTRIDLKSHSRTQVATLVADSPGALGIVRAASSGDGSTLAFNYVTFSSNVYALEEAR